MSQDLTLDDRLIEQAIEAGHHETAEEAVTAALEEYIHSHEVQGACETRPQGRLKILEWVGRVQYFDDYDPKELRRRKIG
jgi:hypothetical protein